MSAESCYDRSCETVPGIDIKNAETFFKMLVELQGEDTIDASTFANACVRMKGAATSIDLQTVMFTTHLMNKDSGKPMHRLNSLNSVAHNWNFLCFCIFRRNRPNIDACFVANTFEPIGFKTFFVLGVCGPTFILGAAKLVEWRGFWKWIFVHTLLHLAASCARRPIVNSILFDTCFTPPMLNPNTAWFIYVLAIQDRGSQADRRNAETLPGATKSLPEFVCSFGADWVRDECRHFWICGLRVPDFWRFTRGRWPTVNPRCAFTSWSSQTKTKIFFLITHKSTNVAEVDVIDVSWFHTCFNLKKWRQPCASMYLDVAKKWNQLKTGINPAAVTLLEWHFHCSRGYPAFEKPERPELSMFHSELDKETMSKRQWKPMFELDLLQKLFAWNKGGWKLIIQAGMYMSNCIFRFRKLKRSIGR